MIKTGFLIILGVSAGFFTGITPGIHPNTVIFGFLPFYFSFEIKLLHFMTFIAALSVSHTFHDFLPSIFLGAPEAETALASLPGVEKAAKGEGIEAFYYTLFGGAFSVAVMVFMAPGLFIALEMFYNFIRPFMHYILIFFVLVLVLRSGDVFSSAMVVLMAGLTGVISLSMPVNTQYVLVPVFSGLFALPAIATSISSSHSLPKQKKPRISRASVLRGGVLGSFAGIFTGVFPGLGPAVSTSFLTPLMDRPNDFLVAMGGVNTSDILMTFLSLYIIGRARSGAAVALQAISEVSPWEVCFLIGVSLFSISISLFLGYRSPRIFLTVIDRFSIQKALISVLLILLISVFALTGVLGVLILFTSSFVGFYAAFKDVRKCSMAVLLMPSILFFSGLAGFI